MKNTKTKIKNFTNRKFCWNAPAKNTKMLQSEHFFTYYYTLDTSEELLQWCCSVNVGGRSVELDRRDMKLIFDESLHKRDAGQCSGLYQYSRIMSGRMTVSCTGKHRNWDEQTLMIQ